MAESVLQRMNPWRGLSGMPREVWVLFTATLVNRAGTMVLPFLVLYLTRSLHLTPAMAGFVVAVYGAGSIVAAPLAGRLCDTVGPIRIMRASLVLTGVVLLLFPFATSLPAVFAAAALLAVVNESFRPANMAIIGELVPPAQRKTAFSVNRLAINLGMSVGPALGGFLATFSFRSLFLVDGLSTLAAAAILLFSRLPDRHQAHASATPSLADDVRAMRDPRLVYFLLCGLLPIGLVFFQHISTMPLFLVRDLGLSAASYGVLFTLNTLLIVMLEVPINIATSHFTHRRTLMIGALLCGAGFGALGVAWSFASVAATVVLWTFGEMFFFPGMAAYVSDIAPPARRGEYMGLLQMTMGLALTVGPWAGTAVLQRLGAHAVWVGTLALGLLATALLTRLREPDGAGEPARDPATGPEAEAAGR